MTTLFHDECKCAVCGHTHTYTVIGSTNSFGYADLDFRPAEMQRSTMHYWLQECPGCGYVSRSVEDEPAVTREFLEQDAYRTCEGIHFESNLAARFYKHYMICMETEKVSGAFHSLLHAAWACDDCDDAENAVLCREKALSFTGRLAELDARSAEAIQVIRMDVLRRSRHFEELKAEFENKTFEEEAFEKARVYQLELAARKDEGGYNFGDVLDD